MVHLYFNPLNPELNPICYLLALLGAHHFFHVSRIRVKSLTIRLLMSYIYIYIYSKTCLKRNLKGPEHFSAKARFPFNQGTLHTV